MNIKTTSSDNLKSIYSNYSPNLNDIEQNLTDGVSESTNGGKGGEGGEFKVSNAEFLAKVFRQLPENAFAAVCSKAGDPSMGGWNARKADSVIGKISPLKNNYIGCSSFYPSSDNTFKARKAQFAACHFLMLDDLGTKVPLKRLADFELSWLIETSPGNFQGGIILADPITEGDVAERLLKAVIDAGLCDAGASGPLSRWARLPVAINGKPKYANEEGSPFTCRLVEYRPNKRYTPEDIVNGLKLELAPIGQSKREAQGNEVDDVLTPRAAENPVLRALKLRGLYKTPLGSGKHDITCPWVAEHTDGLDTGAAYFEPDDNFPIGGYCCQHSHRDKYHLRELLEFLGVRYSEARNKPVIRIVQGDLHRVVDAAEKELANRGRHYQFGGLIVSVSTDPTTGDPSILPISAPALTRELSITTGWEKYDTRSKEWIRCDPPTRHVNILYDSQSFQHLPSLAGVVRQPYFRESDGELITQPGYDEASQLFGVFDIRQFTLPEPTQAAAQSALNLLEELLVEFHFVSPEDKSAALSAIFTAVARPTLKHAPGFHVRAPVFGSGKSYLCEVISAFAGPAGSMKISYPTTSEEATKVILALLLTNPAAIEFDDMDTDWIPHGVIKRMFTAEHITDRILGVSKTATVSTRTLFLGSGNNVGPIRDLLRRVLTIHVDPRCATPATLTYKRSPVEMLSKQRTLYVAAVLTIISAWKLAGSPRTEVENIATYGGEWSDYCRHPLIWMGCADPVAALLSQVKHDPDGESLLGLMTEWYKTFGSTPTTIRKALESALNNNSDLIDAIREFPVEEKGEINPSKFGWFLKKHADRVVNCYKFERSSAYGRTAWCVVKVATPPLPPLP